MSFRSYVLGLSLIMFGLTSGCINKRTYRRAPSINGLRYRASAEIIGTARDTLRVIAKASNRSATGIHLEFSQCSIFNDLKVNVARGKSSWDSRAWEQERQRRERQKLNRRIEEVCAGDVVETILFPGKTFTYQLQLPVAEILGDSLAGGRYKITARLSVNTREIRNINGGEVEMWPAAR